MKIAIIAPFSDKRSTIYGLTHGLQECGHEWVEIESKPNFAAVKIKTPAFAEYVAKQSQDCDTVLIGKGNTIPMHIYNLLVEKCHDTTFLTFDSVSGNGCGPPNRPIELGARGLLCDRILLTGTEGARWFRENGYKGRIAQVYQGCRHHIWKPGEQPRMNQDRVSFLGAHYNGDGGRRAKFKALEKAGFKLHYSRKCFHQEAADLYWNSAICPNFVCGDITSNRVTRILSSGGFCISERNADIDHSFMDGQEMGMFDTGNIEQMVEKFRYYMERPNLREQIALIGHEWTRDKSWAHQAEKMVRFIKGEDVRADGAAAEYTNLWRPGI